MVVYNGEALNVVRTVNYAQLINQFQLSFITYVNVLRFLGSVNEFVKVLNVVHVVQFLPKTFGNGRCSTYFMTKAGQMAITFNY